ncbi:MAG TPA: VOC family protein [Candidatus Paceibacterota bacterium]|nr:VOC family protein [Candidatus Paceibacterota bacterium]
MNTKPIIPHLWFDTEAVEAANFYATVFDNSKVTHVQKISGTPSGDTDIVSFEINGQPFMAISAGPVFTINPSISFFVNYDPSRIENAKEQIDAVWEKLSEGGVALMPLQEYSFSKWYGWIQDRYGVSWQLMLTNPEGEPRPFITPAMMFTGANAGRAEEALNFYTSIFEDGKLGTLARYPAGPDEGKLMYSDFYIHNSWLAAMDSSLDHKFNFNEAVSLLVSCDSQEEIDEYWSKLSAVPEAEQCGWLKDKFGVSWQISPVLMEKMMSEGTPEQVSRVTQAFMQMKKFNLAELQAAYDGA